MIKKLKKNAKRNNRFFWYEDDFVRYKENIKFYGQISGFNYIHSTHKRKRGKR